MIHHFHVIKSKNFFCSQDNFKECKKQDTYLQKILEAFIQQKRIASSIHKIS